MAPDDELTPALSEARQRRATLHDALVHLEIAISSPAAGRIPEWTDLVTKEMVGSATPSSSTCWSPNDPAGCTKRSSCGRLELDGTIRRLKDEHPEIGEKVGEMLARLDQAEIGSPAWPLEDARDDLQRFIGTVIRHRQKGADLVWEAYNVDIGGTE